MPQILKILTTPQNHHASAHEENLCCTDKSYKTYTSKQQQTWLLMQDFSGLGYLMYLLQAIINYLQFNNLLLTYYYYFSIQTNS